jgi:hypothetical protein
MIIVSRDMALLAALCAILATILAGLIEHARDRAIMDEMSSLIVYLARTAKPDIADLQDQALEVRVSAKKAEAMQQRVEAKDAEANEETMIDEEI